MNKLKQLIENLQHSDQATKKTWLVGASSFSMLFVITLWVFYIQSTIQNLNEPKKDELASASFSQVFSTGAQIIKKETGIAISNAVAKLKSSVEEKKSLTIQGANLNFILKDIEPISVQRFPR